MYRADSAAPGSWGTAIYNTRALGGVAPQTYTYTDSAVQSGMLYYYMLKELASDGSGGQYGPVSTGVGLPDQPTVTATATRTASPTLSGTRTATPTRTPLPTWTRAATEAPLPPTATRQFANSPTVPPTATATFGAFQSGLPTPLPPPPVGTGLVSSPTPGAFQPVPVPPRALPSLTPTPFVPQAAVLPTETASPELAATPTPLLSKPDTREPRITLTPEVFEPARGGESRQPTPAAQESARNSTVAFALGGGAIVVALLLGVTGFFLWRARH